MTAPLAQGFPDWGRSADESRTVEILDNPGIHNGVFTYPVRYVGDAKGLQVFAEALTGGLRVEFRFFTDSGGALQTGAFQVDLQLNNTATQAVPILGPYMDVRVTPGAAGNYNYFLAVWHTPSLQSQLLNIPSHLGIAQDGLALGASSSTALSSPYVVAGDIVWWVSTDSTSYLVDVHCLDYLGNELLVGKIDNRSGGSPPQQMGHIPAATLEVAVSNFSAAPATFDIRLTRRPHWTG